MHKVFAFIAGLLVGVAVTWSLVCLFCRLDIADHGNEKIERRGRAALINEVEPSASLVQLSDADNGDIDGMDNTDTSSTKGEATEDDATEEINESETEGKDEEQPKTFVFKDNSKYTNGVEQLLNMALPAAPGAPVPPLPIISDEAMANELARAMQNRIEVEEEDDDKAIERKMQIVQGKLEIAEVTDSGEMTVSEYVNALRDQANDNADFLGEAHKVHDEVYNDDEVTDDEYESVREKINEKLRERGLPEIEEREE